MFKYKNVMKQNIRIKDLHMVVLCSKETLLYFILHVIQQLELFNLIHFKLAFKNSLRPFFTIALLSV